MSCLTINIYLCMYLSIYAIANFCIYLYISFIHLFIYLCISVYIYLFLYIFIYTFIYSFIYLFLIMAVSVLHTDKHYREDKSVFQNWSNRTIKLHLLSRNLHHKNWRNNTKQAVLINTMCDNWENNFFVTSVVNPSSTWQVFCFRQSPEASENLIYQNILKAKLFWSSVCGFNCSPQRSYILFVLSECWKGVSVRSVSRVNMLLIAVVCGTTSWTSSIPAEIKEFKKQVPEVEEVFRSLTSVKVAILQCKKYSVTSKSPVFKLLKDKSIGIII